MLPHRMRLVLSGLALLVGTLALAALADTPSSRADEPPPTATAPLYSLLYLPLVGSGVGWPFPTNIPPTATFTPTATSTRRPTITATVMAGPSVTSGPSATPTATRTPTRTPTATGTLPPGVTPTATWVSLPTETPWPTDTPEPTATPASRVVVVNSTTTLGERGSQPIVSVVGEIRNATASSVADVVVVVALLDDRLVTVKTTMAEVYAGVLGPGQTAPFKAVTERPADCPAEYCTTRVTVDVWQWTTATPQPTLAPPTNTYQAAGSDAALLGRAVNTSGGAIDALRVVAVFRNPQGAVADVFESGFGVDSPYGIIVGPGTWTPYRIGLPTGYGGNAPQYSFMYGVSAAPGPLPLPTSAINEQRGASHLDIWGQVTNTTGGAIHELQVIASFYDAANRVVNVDWAWASQNADRILNPGVTAPFQTTLDGATATAWTRYELQTAYRAAPQPQPAGATLQNPSYFVDPGGLFVTLRGRVVNGTGSPLRQPRLVVTFLKDGKVQYALSARLTVAEGLAAGTSVDYVVTDALPSGVASTLSGATAEYALDVQPE